MTQPWSLWLLPDARDNGKYKNIIKKMSLKTGLTSFEPHLTLFGRIKTNNKRYFMNFMKSYSRITEKITHFDHF